MNANTLFVRLEGPMQAWGNQESKFVIRRTAEAPTKSGVIGMLCSALGVSRPEASEEWLSKLGSLRMGVQMDALPRQEVLPALSPLAGASGWKFSGFAFSSQIHSVAQAAQGRSTAANLGMSVRLGGRKRTGGSP